MAACAAPVRLSPACSCRTFAPTRACCTLVQVSKYPAADSARKHAQQQCGGLPEGNRADACQGFFRGGGPNLHHTVCAGAVRGDLVKVLTELLERKVHFDGVIIETTGTVFSGRLETAGGMCSLRTFSDPAAPEILHTPFYCTCTCPHLLGVRWKVSGVLNV